LIIILYLLKRYESLRESVHKDLLRELSIHERTIQISKHLDKQQPSAHPEGQNLTVLTGLMAVNVLTPLPPAVLSQISTDLLLSFRESATSSLPDEQDMVIIVSILFTELSKSDGGSEIRRWSCK